MSSWVDQFRPDEFVTSVYQIDLDKLKNAGKKLILTDLDNTLVPWNHPDAPVTLLEWFKTARDMGFAVCILSNNRGERVQQFAEKTGIPAVGQARKPKRAAYESLMKQYKLSAHETVMIGDQLFTDIRGARRCGIHAILVVPIDRREWWGTKLVRLGESFVMKRLEQSGLEKASDRPGR